MTCLDGSLGMGAGVLAQAVDLPGIVGAFLAGLAVNATVHDKPAKEKLEFFARAFFVPIFFVATGFLIDPVVFVESIVDSFPLVAAIVAFETTNPLHQRLVDQRMLNVVLVLVLTTAMLGPLLTHYFAPRMVEASRRASPRSP